LKIDFTPEVQELFIRMMVSNPELYTRVLSIVNPLNFDRSLRKCMEFIVDHTSTYSIMPDPTQILATTGKNIEIIPDLTESHGEWFITEFENFTKRQELERAILKSAEYLEKGDYEPVEKLIKDAVQISLQTDLGTDYFANPIERNEKYFNQGGQISTGWPQMDRILYGGFDRGTLNIFAAPSGGGKSLVMMNLALNWLQMGMNGVYITMELGEEQTSLRTDAMLTGMSTKEIRKNLEDAALKVRISSKKMGQYRVKRLPAQSNINAVRSYISELRIQTGMKIDFIIIDYLDLMSPATVKVNASDVFTKDKYVSEEIRNYSIEENLIAVTASQINRSGVDEVEYSHASVAGGISKIYTGDNVFGIFTSRSLKERGKYLMQCLKSRNSTGVDQKIELDYNIETMRITDSDPSEAEQEKARTSSIMSQIKTRVSANTSDSGEVVITNREEPSSAYADVQGSKLKSLLNSLKDK